MPAVYAKAKSGRRKVMRSCFWSYAAPTKEMWRTPDLICDAGVELT